MNVVEVVEALSEDPENSYAQTKSGIIAEMQYGVLTWKRTGQTVLIHFNNLDGWTIKRKTLPVGTKVMIPAEIKRVTDDGKYELSYSTVDYVPVWSIYRKDQFEVVKEQS